MGIPINTGGGSTNPPAVDLTTIGNLVRFAVIDVDEKVPVYVYGVTPPTPELNKYGKPKMQNRITVLIISHDGATTKGDRTEVDAVGSIYAAGYTKWDPNRDALGGSHVSWGAAVDTLDGGLEVGDVGEWKYLGDFPGDGPVPRKDRKFRLRKSKPEEAEQTARCERLNKELNGMALASQGAGDAGYEEDPF